MRNIREIFYFLKPHWKLTLLAPLLVSIEVCAELVQPILMAEIVNEGIISRNYEVILPLGIKMLAITLFGMFGGVLSIYAAGKVSYAFGADMRLALFQKVENFSFLNIDKFQSGSLITRMTNDVMLVQQVVQASMRLLFRAPLLFFGSVVMIFSINKNVATVLLFLLPVLLFCIIFILRRASPLFLKIQQKIDRLNVIIQETMFGIRVVKAYVQEKREKKRFASANDELIRTTLRTSKIIVFLMPMVTLIMNLGIVAVIWIGAIAVTEEKMNVGDIMACINYLSQILISLMMASRVIMSITEAEASMVRICEVLYTKNELIKKQENFPKGRNKIYFDRVNFQYKKTFSQESIINNNVADGCILKNISFSIKEGETLAIMGGPGSGKSTLVHLLSGFYNTTSGNIYIGGKNIRDIAQKELRRNVGIVMQKTILFSGTIAENLRFGKNNATDEELIEVCKQVQIHDFIISLEHGYNHYIEQGAVNLSGGQKQRLSIARTLLGKPQILILDDCLSAIDFRTDAFIRGILKNISATKVIVTQRINSVINADKILILENGDMIGFGTNEELLQDCDIYKEIYFSQIEED